MKNAEFWMPVNLEELTEALRNMDENTYICAGGTDLIIHLRNKKKFHYSLIDLTHLQEITAIKEQEDEIVIGAGVTMTQLERSDVIRKYIPALGEAAAMVGSTQIRNRATLGGNVANASQSSDTTPVLLAYQAKAVIQNGKGEQIVLPVDDFVEGLEKTRLSKDQVILYFIVKKDTDVSAFAKTGARKAVTISKINGCIKTELDQGILKHVCVYLGAVGPKASEARLIEDALEGKALKDLDDDEIRDAVYAQIEANIPDRASKHYKKSAAFGLVQEMLEKLGKEAAD